jgi:hypothetical protein
MPRTTHETATQRTFRCRADAPERRKFARFAAEMPVHVRAGTEDGIDFVEQVRTVDVSGEGLKVRTENASRYRMGQAVTVSVPLPGTGAAGAQMTGTGRIVRIESTGGSGEVAIHLSGPLRFSRTAPACGPRPGPTGKED